MAFAARFMAIGSLLKAIGSSAFLNSLANRSYAAVILLVVVDDQGRDSDSP